MTLSKFQGKKKKIDRNKCNIGISCLTYHYTVSGFFFSFKISTERLLLADQNKWEKAIKMIMNTFDDAAKWTKNASHKNGQYTCTILY